MKEFKFINIEVLRLRWNPIFGLTLQNLTYIVTPQHGRNSCYTFFYTTYYSHTNVGDTTLPCFCIDSLFILIMLSLARNYKMKVKSHTFVLVFLYWQERASGVWNYKTPLPKIIINLHSHKFPAVCSCNIHSLPNWLRITINLNGS